MRLLLHIAIALVAICMVATSCRTTKTEYVYKHDTLTIERGVTQTVVKHDTLTITNEGEGEGERVELDSMGKPTVITKWRWRDRILVEKGSKETDTIHDTITVQKGSTNERVVTKQVKVLYTPWWIYALGVAFVVLIGLTAYKSRRIFS